MSIACILAQLSQNIQTGILVGLWQADHVQLPECLTRCTSRTARCCRASGSRAEGGEAVDVAEGDQVELLENGKV
jgi:hypothetical protein